MPLFEFVCEECGVIFEELVRSAATISGVICPDCQSDQVKKKISTFVEMSRRGVSTFLGRLSCKNQDFAPFGVIQQDVRIQPHFEFQERLCVEFLAL